MLHKYQHSIQVLKFALLLFFIGHYSGSTMFYHVHEIEGQVYSHSHFFGFNLNNKGVPVTGHTHTAKQFQLIQLFNHIVLTAELGSPEVPAPVIRYVLQHTNNPVNRIYLPLQADLRLRAPPAC